MKAISIKAKLIALFVIIKILPLLAISYIAYAGVIKLEEYLNSNTEKLFKENKDILVNTADAAIEDSIKNLDEKSQSSLERATKDIADEISNFLYERDNDLLFLSKLNLNQNVLKNFYDSKLRDITLHGEYYYDDESQSYKTNENVKPKERAIKEATLEENSLEFNYFDPYNYDVKAIPIYKEVVYFDLKGQEKFKISQIDSKLNDVSNKKNTYVNSETYFEEIKSLKEGEIYVSDVIGEYVGTKIVGTFTKEKAKQLGIAFEPEKYAYSGLENPVGKKFEGIVRFITPVYEGEKKVGYISLALDHLHLREFTATYDPTGVYNRQNIIDPRVGNYAFIWDHEGKSIVHPRDHSILGYDKNTGKKVMPWLPVDVAEKFYSSGKEINEFLEDYPKFEDQTTKKKPNIKQIKEEGLVGLDCRYLNFAPQCVGWFQLTENGGYGSHFINWTGVFKLSTAAAIPYYTGKYKNSPRGFGYVAIGANVDEFHAATNKTKEEIDGILKEQTTNMQSSLDNDKKQVEGFIALLINELTTVTIVMVILVIVIAIWMSNYITSKINNLLVGTQKFANKEFEYKIDVTSKDEIGQLEESFNLMAGEINTLVQKIKDENFKLEDEVHQANLELIRINQDLEQTVEARTESLKEALIKAQNSDRVKSNFLANMSHEIRTPLNSIIGFSELLKTAKLDETSLKFASIIETNSKSLLAILNDILDVSKLESGTFEIKEIPTDIHSVTKQVFDNFSQKALEKDISFVYNVQEDIPHTLITDGVRIRQILSNLVSNAVKFTQNLGKVELKVSKINEDDNYINLRFQVQDNGIGIPKDKLTDIFSPFVQVEEDSNRKFEGTGLGLSICDQIIKLFNSNINLETVPNEGSNFWFDLKMKKTEDNIVNQISTSEHYLPNETLETKTIQESDEKVNGNINLTIVEKNPLNKELMNYYLGKLNAKYTFVDELPKNDINSDSKEVSVVMIDYEELLDLINNEFELSQQVIVLTQKSISSEEKEGLSSYNIVGYVQKPLKLDNLKALLDEVVVPINEEIEIVDNKGEDIVMIDEKQEETLEDKEVVVTYKKEDTMNQLCLDELTVSMLLDNFFLTMNVDIQKLQDAIDSNVAEDIVNAAHYLKGSCSNLAMKDASEILLDIETRAKDGETSFELTTLRKVLDATKSLATA